MTNNFKKIMEKVTGSFEDKKEWRLYKKRIRELPKDYKNAMEGVETYMMNFGGGPEMIDVLYSILDMFEEAIADNKQVSDIIGNDIGVFCEDIIKAVPGASWMENYKKKIQNKINKKMNKDGE